MKSQSDAFRQGGFFSSCVIEVFPVCEVLPSTHYQFAQTHYYLLPLAVIHTLYDFPSLNSHRLAFCDVVGLTCSYCCQHIVPPDLALFSGHLWVC